MSQIILPDNIKIFPAANQALDEFGGLTIEMPHGTYTLNPLEAEWSEADCALFEHLTGRQGYPLGSFDGCDYCDIIIDENGVVYFISDELQPFATSMRRAIQNVLTSRRDTEVDFRRLGCSGASVAWENASP